MKQITNIVLLIGFVVTTVVAQEYIGSAGQNMTIVRGPSGKIGYTESVYGIDIKDAKVLIPYKFDWANEFNDAGFAVVEIANKFGVIDKTGKTIVPIEYEYALNVENGMSVVSKAGKFGAVDLTGKLVVPLEYEFLGSFDTLGYAPATKWGQSGIISKRNEVIVSFDYLSAGSSDGYSRVLSATGWKNFDPAGKEHFEGYEHVSTRKGGYLAANKPAGATGLFTKSGAPVLPEEYKWIEVASNGRTAILEKDRLRGLYDLKTQSWLIPMENEGLSFEGEDLVNVWKTDENGPAYITDLSGRRVSRAEYLEVHSLGAIGFKVNQGNKWGVIDRAGNAILPAEFDEGIRFVRGATLIAARRLGDVSCRQCGWGLTDLKGRTILPFQYGKPDRNHFSKTFSWEPKTNPFDFDSGEGKEYAAVLDLLTMKPGIVDNDGNWVLRNGAPYDDFGFTYSRRKSDSGNMLPVKRDGKWGVYDLNARREIVPPTVVFDEFDNPTDEGSYARFLDRDRDAWGIIVYETGQVFKPGAFSYHHYNSESKLLEVGKGGKSHAFAGDITNPQNLALQMVSGDDELKGLMRLDGTMVTKIEYSKLAYNRELPGYWAVKNDKGGWIAVSGNGLIPHKFDLAMSGEAGELFGAIKNQQFFDSNGVVDVIYNGEVVLIDRKGSVVKRSKDFALPRYASIQMGDLGRTKYHYAFVERDEKYHLKYLIDGRLYDGESDSFSYLSIGYSDDLALLKRNGLYGYIDRSGKEVIPFIYQKASGFSGGIAQVHTDKDVFLINREGKRLYSHGGILTLLSRKERGLPLVLNSELVRTVEVEEAKIAFDNGALMIDTRSAEGFAGEHIRGAINITKATLEANIAQLPKNKKIVTYCSCPREESSGAVAYELKKRGYTEVYALRGGTTAWKDAGFPMEK